VKINRVLKLFPCWHEGSFNTPVGQPWMLSPQRPDQFRHRRNIVEDDAELMTLIARSGVAPASHASVPGGPLRRVVSL